MGELRIEYDGTNYAEVATAKQASILYNIDHDWELLVEFVNSDRSIPEALRKAFPNRLYRISLLSKKRISFNKVTFPATMKKTEVRLGPAAWIEYADGTGLCYHVMIANR